jgi:phage shock protein A
LALTKKDYEELVGVYKDTINNLRELIEDLKKDKKTLQEQVFKLQDGLMAVRAPEAYRDHRADLSMLDDSPVSEEARERRRIHTEVTQKYLDGMESPLFTGAEEMLEGLTNIVLKDAGETEPLHENDES